MRSPPPGKSAALPRRVEQLDVAELDLTPAEAFVLTQLDGSTDLSEVAAVTALSEDEVERTVKRLGELGAVEVTSSPRRARFDLRREDDEPIAREEVFRPARAEPTRERSAPTTTPDEVDLDAARRALIDDLHGQLGLATHYQLLDLEPHATKSEIKEAYFKLIGVFHPDKYFGRALGSYQKKLEQSFEALTRAYETLSREKSRDEYDEYLGLRKATRALDAVIRSIPPPPRAPEPPSYEAPTRNEVLASATKRRRRLADRIKSSKAAESEAGPKLSPDEALDRLKRLAATRSPPRRTDDFRAAGERALGERQWTAAVTSLRIASVLAPDDEQISAHLQDAEQHAAEELADTYFARAVYEERNHQWADAAKSYERVAAGRPKDAEPLARAARCRLHTGDAREAVNLARRAVMLEPNAASHRLVLARAYEANDLPSSSLGELERAEALKKGDPDIRAWIARLQKALRDPHR